MNVYICVRAPEKGPPDFPMPVCLLSFSVQAFSALAFSLFKLSLLLLSLILPSQRSSLKYGRPSAAGGWFSFLFNILIIMSTAIVTRYGNIL